MLKFVVGNVPVHGDLILAPMAGYSDQPYRSICRRMGSAMSYTEFVSAHGVLRANQRTLEILRFDHEERPIVFQVFGHNTETMTEACLRLQEMGPDIIDINMGCPSSRIANRGSGAGLLCEPSQVARIFAALSKHLSVPITAKVRLGWDQESRNHIEIAHILEDNGAALIAVHGRTQEDNYKIPADWDAIAEVKQAVHIPVLGNGDVRCTVDIDRITEHTHCDGIMIGRGAIGNPWIFGRREQKDISLQERVDLIREHIEGMVAFYGPRRGVLAFRKHVVQYVRGLPNASQLRAKLVKCVTQSDVIELLTQILE